MRLFSASLYLQLCRHRKHTVDASPPTYQCFFFMSFLLHTISSTSPTWSLASSSCSNPSSWSVIATRGAATGMMAESLSHLRYADSGLTPSLTRLSLLISRQPLSLHRPWPKSSRRLCFLARRSMSRCPRSSAVEKKYTITGPWTPAP